MLVSTKNLYDKVKRFIFIYFYFIMSVPINRGMLIKHNGELRIIYFQNTSNIFLYHMPIRKAKPLKVRM